jgi:DNA-binding transcriptional regulator YdaS (Cro superfamily)
VHSKHALLAIATTLNALIDPFQVRQPEIDHNATRDLSSCQMGSKAGRCCAPGSNVHSLTQGEAAARIGIHRVHLNQFLMGERRPGLDAAILLEDATGIPVRAWRKARRSLSVRQSESDNWRGWRCTVSHGF